SVTPERRVHASHQRQPECSRVVHRRWHDRRLLFRPREWPEAAWACSDQKDAVELASGQSLVLEGIFPTVPGLQAAVACQTTSVQMDQLGRAIANGAVQENRTQAPLPPFRHLVRYGVGGPTAGLQERSMGKSVKAHSTHGFGTPN